MQKLSHELRLRRTKIAPADADNILDYVVKVSPRLRRPDHFRLFARRIEETLTRPVRCTIAAPPQHGKTQITLHGLVWLIRKAPEKRHAYITYNLKRARKVAKLFRKLLSCAGIAWSGTLDCIDFADGGQVIFTSIDSGLMGDPVDGVAIVDDPYQGPKDAESKARREDIDEAYRQGILTRVHPSGSILVLATRWHPQDLTAVLVAEGVEHINLPAIAEENDANGRDVGEALFPEERPLEWLKRQMVEVGDYAWAALYQGRPRPKGGKVFHEPTFYTELPKVYRGAFGVDLAYTARTSADWSICLELWRAEQGVDDNGEKRKPLFYVVHVERAQSELPAFVAILRAKHQLKKAFQMLWRASGTEKGSAQLIKFDGIPLQIQNPPGDKFVSSQAVAAAWNDGRVLVPDSEKFPGADRWLIPFLGVVGDFTGSNKEPDDDVDGLGNAHHLLREAALTAPPSNDNDRKRPERESARKMVGF